MSQQLLERSTRAWLTQHRDDRVVAGHRAGDPGQAGLVDPSGDEVRGSGRCLDHCHGLDELDRQHELTHQRHGAAVTLARADQSELLDVPGDRRLGRSQPTARERLRNVLLRVRGTAIHHVEDGVMALALGRRQLDIDLRPAVIASRIVEWARSIWAWSIISGGTSRTEWSSTALTIKPASRHDCCKALARGSANSNACISPRPRTSFAPRSSSDSWRT